MDSSIKTFKFKGNLYLWIHKKEPSWWNITADSEGCESIISYLTLLENSSESEKRSFKLTVPTKEIRSVPLGDDRNGRFVIKEEVVLDFLIGEKDDLWKREESESGFHITFGKRWIEKMKNSFERTEFYK